MNIHEYQGKALLKANGVPVLEGVHCTSVEQALMAYDKLGSKVVAVKSQIHAGGRGKGTLFNPETREHVMDGGVKIAFSKDEVEKYSSHILGNLLVTIQTGDEGKVVNNLYIESGCEIEHEYYLAHHCTNKYSTEQLLFHLILIKEVVHNGVPLLKRCYIHSEIV